MNSNNILDQAEKGLAEAVLPNYHLSPPSSCDEDPAKTATNSVTDLKLYDEKKVYEVDVKVATAEVQAKPEKTEVSQQVVKKEASSKPKPKFKRASLWIRFNLWYNTYRFVDSHHESGSFH